MNEQSAKFSASYLLKSTMSEQHAQSTGLRGAHTSQLITANLTELRYNIDESVEVLLGWHS